MNLLNKIGLQRRVGKEGEDISLIVIRAMRALYKGNPTIIGLKELIEEIGKEEKKRSIIYNYLSLTLPKLAGKGYLRAVLREGKFEGIKVGSMFEETYFKSFGPHKY